MSSHDEEEKLLRSVALQNASTVLAARQRAEQELIQAKEQADRLAIELRTAVRNAELVADVARALTGIEPLPDLLRSCAEALVRHLDAALARVWTLSQDGKVLELQASAGMYTHLDGPHGRVPVGAFKIGLIAEERTPHLTNDVQRDPRVSDKAWAIRERMVAFAGYPLLVQDRLVGVVAMFSRASASEEVLETLASVADIVALGIERRRAEAERAELVDRKEFLTEATPALATVLDVKKTLTNLARLVVPKLADWCSIEMLKGEGPEIEPIAVAHVDPAKVAMAEDLRSRYPTSKDAPRGVPSVIRSGQPELWADIPDEILVNGAKDAEHLRILRELRLRSVMIVPLKARGRTLGAITFVSSDPTRRYSADDVQFAEELARRAAIAVDNARLYESEQAARRNADLASRAKDDFLATVSHELRTPLNVMLGWTRMLRRGDLSKERHDRALETIERNAVTQTQLIEDLLDVSRIISGKLRLDVQSVELSHIVEHAIDALRLAADAKSVRIVANLDDNAGPIMGDPHRLQQVVWNLLSNALKFTAKGGRVQLTVERVDSTLKLSVTDNGRGIDPEFLPHVFERFQQANGATTRTYGGLGLGLAICRHIVELHGGQIEAHSKGEGHGATFTVLLPVSPIRQTQGTRSRLSSIAGAPIFDKRPELENLRVLVVDDEEDARELVVAILQVCGSIVSTAGSAAEAMEKLRTDKPQVLVSDIGMPGEDGYDLMRRIRALEPEDGGNIPAAALTAYARVEDRRKALDAGFMMHIPKPVEPAELIAVIASLTRFGARR